MSGSFVTPKSRSVAASMINVFFKSFNSVG
jgi:hypothetical protein